MKKFRDLAFTRYHAHATASCNKQGPIVSTTWLAATLEKRTVDEKCEFLAKSAFREYLDHQLHGESHWSHVKYCTTTPKNGDVVVGSYRKMYETIVEARREGFKLEIFGSRIAAKYAGIFELKQEKGQPHPAALIAKYLRILVARAAKVIEERMPGKDAEHYPHGNCASCDIMGPHERARFDGGLNYNTCMGVGEMPWFDDEQWKEFEISADDLQDASNEWLQLVGVLA